MIGCILTGHGSFAPGLAGALTMITGPQEYFEIVPFEENQSLEQLAQDFDDKLKQLQEQCDGVIVFCDLLGGTPFKTAMIASQEVANVEVIAGANLPLLIETLGLRLANPKMDNLIATIVETAQTGIVHAKLEINNEPTSLVEEGI